MIALAEINLAKWTAATALAKFAATAALAEDLDPAPSRDGQSVALHGTDWYDRTPARKLDWIRSAFIAADLCAGDPAAQIVFWFSGTRVAARAAQGLIERWIETSEPPVMSIIDFTIADGGDRHATIGLTAFVGFELAVVFSAALFERDALRDLVRLVRFVLLNGPIRVGQWFTGVSCEIPLLKDGAHAADVDYWFCLVTEAGAAVT